MTETASNQEYQQIVQRIETEILPLLDRAVHDDTVYFANQHLTKCWEKKNCEKKDCPVSAENLRCWQVAGTYCGGKVQGIFVDKYHNCKTCDVFLDACPTIVEKIGEHLNNMLFLLRQEKDSGKKRQKKIEYLNKELLSSLENLDARNREIQELMITDKLTGLYNRHHLMTQLDDEISRCERTRSNLSLLMIDVDDFKSFNDTYGHLNGDTVLSRLGQLIKSGIRKYDHAFRYGGEEFVIVLPETDATIAWMVAERIRKNFAGEIFKILDDDEEKVEQASRTLSVGIVNFISGMTGTKMLTSADEAMYEAKSLGKNRVFRYGEEM